MLPPPVLRRAILATGLCALLAAAPAAAAVDPSGAAAIFKAAKAISDHDGGRFWGQPLYGPMLLVDWHDRGAIANQADPGGVLKPAGAVFAGRLPDEVLISNSPVEWSGIRWTELIWPVNHFGTAAPTDVSEAAVLHVTLAHEMFHRIQPQLGLMREEQANAHLDTLEGRYLLQLEWRALARALTAPAGAERRQAVADALAFRRERYRLFPHAATEELALEVDEGVPEYTGVRLGLDRPAERTAYAVHDLKAFVDAPTFVRSFAYATGPAYGLLLDQADPRWRSKLNSGQRLDQLLAQGMRLEPAADLPARISAYDDGTLRRREEAREQARLARLAQLKAKLVDGPVLVLPLSHMNYQFNPQTLIAMSGVGTVYPTIRIVCDWGVLEVADGALLDTAMKTARVSAAGIDADGLKGPGWTLTLNRGWGLKPGPRTGDFTVAPR